MNQVAKDEELLDIAKDYFQFVTKFFEVINVSAPHIYPPALELCPTSLNIRKLDYWRIIRFSRVVGTPDSAVIIKIGPFSTSYLHARITKTCG